MDISAPPIKVSLTWDDARALYAATATFARFVEASNTHNENLRSQLRDGIGHREKRVDLNMTAYDVHTAYKAVDAEIRFGSDALWTGRHAAAVIRAAAGD
jgi:hypothetical protein